ncbi:MAG: hypothetical protein HLUCCO17_07610 [Saliniramus fredricksonii]|uniref:Uncharacterized protein n=1 Tax=Saliniramus fredricksonii TaxID=1653334 RepID=A0A0N8KEG1_9HYPH|nr:MAG: hypothetical protein HLUCCO17_07610 [Saliniramus fredricksonii]SCC81773.1 hypothetical protein GA0071312_2736 [Saliniramus fredricksonii]
MTPSPKPLPEAGQGKNHTLTCIIPRYATSFSAARTRGAHWGHSSTSFCSAIWPVRLRYLVEASFPLRPNKSEKRPFNGVVFMQDADFKSNREIFRRARKTFRYEFYLLIGVIWATSTFINLILIILGNAYTIFYYIMIFTSLIYSGRMIFYQPWDFFKAIIVFLLIYVPADFFDIYEPLFPAITAATGYYMWLGSKFTHERADLTDI